MAVFNSNNINKNKNETIDDIKNSHPDIINENIIKYY
jgi:hypothetical protein